ncbi:MAG TPA: protoporphyrinogen oxidase, partial [Bryobacteraceae bacterium]|nr:protoporphyrinogen oxidase [Bryobacteraceae bacterium]
WMEAEHVVLATTAFDAEPMLHSVDGELAALVGTIPYTSSITLSLGYNKATFDRPLHGHGFLVPKLERKYLMGCTFVGNKFDNRAAGDIELIRCFIGGNGFSLHDEQLVEVAREELRAIMGIRSEPVFHSIARWRNSMAQYTVGHQKRIQRVDAILETIPGLYLAGNGYRGIGIPDCVKTGKDAAARIASAKTTELRLA